MLSRLSHLCATRVRHDTDPFISAYVDNIRSTTLIDTGAAQSFISASLWSKLGTPTLTHPTTCFISADNSNVELLGRVKLPIQLAGRRVNFPFWVMTSALTDCIVGIDLLRYLGAVINLRENTLSFENCDELISLSRLDPQQSARLILLDPFASLPQSRSSEILSMDSMYGGNVAPYIDHYPCRTRPQSDCPYRGRTLHYEFIVESPG